MNVTLGSGKAVHADHISTVDGESTKSPECGGNRAGERYAYTTREVTCKKCLKWLAANEVVETPAAEVVETPAAEVVETPAAEVAPIVAELNNRPAVWMVQEFGRTMWIAEGVPGLFTSKARATAALSRWNTTATV